VNARNVLLQGIATSRIRKSLLGATVSCALMGVTSTAAIGGIIESWNTNNVMTTPALDADGNGFSFIYDQDPGNPGASTSAYIKFTPPETESPGLKVENNAPPSPGDGTGTAYGGGDVYNCIISAGPSTCNGPFQSGKRFKFDATGFEPVDLVFNVEPDGTFPSEIVVGNNTIDTSGNDGLYKVFQKYGNATGEEIGSFSVELGFGIGDGFVASTVGDGLGFVDFGADPEPNEFSAQFAAGLFGPGGSTRHPLPGYFDSTRAGYNLELVSEDFFQSAGMFGAYESLFGDWLPYSGTPQGFLYDDDGDPGTDAILMANQEEDGTWSVNRGIDAAGDVYTLADGDKQTGLTIDQVIAFLNTEGSFCEASSTPDPVICVQDAIEDLAKFNLTYFLDQLEVLPDNPLLLTAYDNQPTFTLRITANEVPTAGVLPMLGLGLLGMLAARRRSGARAQG